MSQTADGVIKSLPYDRETRARKGFGFIQPADGGAPLFFHKSALQGCSFDECEEGDAVTFEPGHGAKGPRAENVRPKE